MDNQCIEFNHNNKFNVNINNRLQYDKCYKDIQTKQSRENSNYFLRNFHACNLKYIDDLAYSQERIIYRDGYGSIGKNGMKVDRSTKMRNSNLTNFKHINQLEKLPYNKSPNL